VSASLDEARQRMVRRQLAARDITDPSVLDAMAAVPREQFVARIFRGAAYADHPLPIDEGQTISQPYVVALMAQLLELGPEDKVLEVGTGSGYAAAVLGRLAGEVHTIERIPTLARSARRVLAALGVDNVHVHDGDGCKGWPAAAPYDGIVAAAAAAVVPPALVQQLAPGGRLVLPVGPSGGSQELVRIRRIGANGELEQEDLGPVSFVPLIASR
jgi:protein-L-isoaspartate(D-aspartate) O-methyltransferase